MCFTILACGFVPRCALDYSDSGEIRFQKILEILCDCDQSIHDLSRVELDDDSNLPRFNMPLELGADLGLRLKGGPKHRKRRTLVLEAVPHRYDKTLSDISGQDVETHGNDVQQMISRVRDWLNVGPSVKTPLPGADALAADYAAYEALVPDILTSLRLDSQDKLTHPDFIHTVEIALPLVAVLG